MSDSLISNSPSFPTDSEREQLLHRIPNPVSSREQKRVGFDEVHHTRNDEAQHHNYHSRGIDIIVVVVVVVVVPSSKSCALSCPCAVVLEGAKMTTTRPTRAAVTACGSDQGLCTIFVVMYDLRSTGLTTQIERDRGATHSLLSSLLDNSPNNK